MEAKICVGFEEMKFLNISSTTSNKGNKPDAGFQNASHKEFWL